VALTPPGLAQRQCGPVFGPRCVYFNFDPVPSPLVCELVELLPADVLSDPLDPPREPRHWTNSSENFL